MTVISPLLPVSKYADPSKFGHLPVDFYKLGILSPLDP